MAKLNRYAFEEIRLVDFNKIDCEGLMSIKFMQAVFESDLPPMQRLVLLAIADHADAQGRAYPSMIGIAAKCGMTDRGARKIVRQLEGAGYLSTEVGGGRGGKSHYTINPEPYSRNIKPGIEKPGTRVSETRNESVRNPEPRSPEPSITVIEPSGYNNAREIREHLERWASPEAVTSFIAYRRKQKGKALTVTAAKRQASQLEKIFQARGDPDDALGMAEERGWQSVQADWYFKAKGNGNGNGNGNYGAQRQSNAGIGQKPATSIAGIVAQRRLAERE